jgi:hypothetical protein
MYHPIADEAIRKEWNSWFERFCPKSDSAAEYVAFLKANRIAWHIPSKLFYWIEPLFSKLQTGGIDTL